jgi:AbrB family looped-hinge helix DNA binding protein
LAYTDDKKVGKSNDAKELTDMLTELRTKSQITIPKDIVARLGLHEGDKLEIVEKDGTIQIMPVAVYPKKYLDELRSEINETKAKIAAGEQPVFDTVDELFEMLDGVS